METSSFQQAIGKYYKMLVLEGKPKDEASRELRQLLAFNHDAKKEAQAKLDSLNKLAVSVGGNLASRCFVSHIQLQALKEILNG